MKGLYAAAGHCDEVAWNARSRKYLRHGTLEGRLVRILVDTGCDRTMISAGQVPSSKVDHSTVVPVLCVHGDTMQYPTAWVELRLGQWRERCHVVVAPNLPVDVLLGTDTYPMERAEVVQSLAVWTWSKQRKMERHTAGPQKGQRPTPVGRCSLSPPADPQTESEGGGNQLQGLEVEAGEESEDPQPVGHGTKGRVMTGSETGGGDDAVTRGALQASLSQLQQWQQEDPSLGKAREAAQASQPEGAGSRVYFFYRHGLLR